MNYEVYHDESKNAGYWHGMLLVPEDSKERLIKHLSTIRKNVGFFHPISLKQVKGTGRIFTLARAWVHLGVGFMMQKKGKDSYSYYTESGYKKGIRNEYGILNDILKCKFIVFRERDNLSKMDSHIDWGSKMETTYRMGLKGGLHFFGSDENPIHITRLHFDNHKHLKRPIDKNRIIGRMKDMRQYITFYDDMPVNDLTSDHRDRDKQDYGDCQILQLTDLLIGVCRTFLGEKTKEIHAELGSPMLRLINEYNKGPARMKNSRWGGGLCLSQCYLENNVWNYGTLEPLPEQTDLIQEPLKL